MALPSDPIMLLSVVNLKLRDFYPSLDALCDDMDADRDALCKALSAVGYAYDAARVSQRKFSANHAKSAYFQRKSRKVSVITIYHI